MKILFYERDGEVFAGVEKNRGNGLGIYNVIRHMERMTPAELAAGLSGGFYAAEPRKSHMGVIDESISLHKGAAWIGHIVPLHDGDHLALFPELLGGVSGKVFPPDNLDESHIDMANGIWHDKVADAVQKLYGAKNKEDEV